MTDKEKAKSICCVYIDNCDEKCKTCRRGSEFFDLMKMANWKDRQFRKIIEKTIDLFDKYPSNAAFPKDNVVKMFKTLKKAIKE